MRVAGLLLLFLTIAAGGLLARAGEPAAERVLLDTDIGTDVDDALALVLAARSRGVELVSVTTVGGKPGIRAAMAERLLALVGKQDIPVAAGLARPLPSERYQVWMPQGLWMGHEGRGLLSDEEIAAIPPGEGAGVDQIISTLLGSKTKLTVVTIGPVSNFGAALKREPAIAEKVKRYVAMGGSVMANPQLGSRELSPMAEFNFNADREAAAIALAAGIPTTLVPIEVTIRTYLTADDVETLRGADDPAARALARLLDVWGPIFRNLYLSFGLPRSSLGDWVCHLHDPLAILVVTRPELFSFAEVRITPVEQDGIFRTRLSNSGEFPLRVVTAVDVQAVRNLVMKRLRGEDNAQGKEEE